jgi:hypothetical protein
MPDQERKRSSVASELAALLQSGDHRAAAILARQALSQASRPADHQAARAALARVKPEKAALITAVAGLVLLVLAALLGLRT